MLAEFKYGLVPKESFADYFGDQAVPRALYYYLKKVRSFAFVLMTSPNPLLLGLLPCSILQLDG